ncbi:undecaprenyl-diphosphate phosphatase [Patulibacter sp. NPDC049589]|uniref:undecaprenyl-diphosphate phosphatase n=1 Tax=Patulibacter sp. NPDC049589 TaxID=3154731 RepID=UPI003437F2EE
MTVLPPTTPQLSPRRSLAAALLAGALHGPAEALPVSSSAHVAFVARLAAGRRGRRPSDPEVAKSVEVGAHAGTLLGLTIGLRREAVKASAGVLREPRLAAVTALRIVAASAPAVVGALTLERQIERHLGGDRTIALGLVAGSLAMVLADATGAGGAWDLHGLAPAPDDDRAAATRRTAGASLPGDAGLRVPAAPGDLPAAVVPLPGAAGLRPPPPRPDADAPPATAEALASPAPRATVPLPGDAGLRPPATSGAPAGDLGAERPADGLHAGRPDGGSPPAPDGTVPRGPGRPWEDGTVVDALLIGTAQAAALWPGVSRSGAVLVAARARGFSREASGKISAALAVPAVGGATALKVARLGVRLRAGTIDPRHLVPLLAVTTTGAISGVAAAPMARRTLEGLPLWPFAGYRVLLATALAAADCRWRR